MNLLGNPLTVEETITLNEMASHHPYGNFRTRALGLLAVNDGEPVVVIAKILRIHTLTIYRWAEAWRTDGLVGLLGGHAGGRPSSLKDEWLDSAEHIARETPLTLREIAVRLNELHPEFDPTKDLRPLAQGLKQRGLSFKRTRLSLKKDEIKHVSIPHKKRLTP